MALTNICPFRCNLPELDGEAMTEAYSDDAAHIASVLLAAHGDRLANSLPAVNVLEPEINVYSSASKIDISELFHLRYQHQTKQAETGVHKFGNLCNSKSESAQMDQHKAKPLTERQQILRRFSEIIKQQNDRGIGMGLERAARWKATATGNSANAAMTASAALTKVSLSQMTFYVALPCYFAFSHQMLGFVFFSGPHKTKANIPQHWTARHHRGRACQCPKCFTCC
jgi:hypothetical protein